MPIAPLKHGPWNLKDLESVPKTGLKVFSCFHCGGGSTMGYKLAGYDVLGGVEIDPEMMAIYRANHKPRHSYLMGVQQFKNIPDKDLPKELFELDVLDGSPPCSSFSMAGSREKAWGEKKKFREGQAEQVLDDLFFDFIAIAKKLKPKVVVAENVKGLVQGNARGYVKEIFAGFKDAGYECQLFLLNAAAMGVPQRRERTVFIATRNALPKLNLEFNEAQISAYKATDGSLDGYLASGANVRHCAASRRPKWDSKKCPAPTVMATNGVFVERRNKLGKWEKCSPFEVSRLQSYPDDFNYLRSTAHYVCGMSVPPFMMQRIALEIQKQFFHTIPAGTEEISDGR